MKQELTTVVACVPVARMFAGPSGSSVHPLTAKFGSEADMCPSTLVLKATDKLITTEVSVPTVSFERDRSTSGNPARGPSGGDQLSK